MHDALEFTGERFLPGVAGEIWYEHWHRYHFVAPLVAGREVLDVACGAGYGSALLARTAAKVTGADVSPAAIAHAGGRYGSVRNLAFVTADCAALPFPDASFDAVVSFETIEHIAAQDAFLDEARRVLRPGGLFVLSCPNKVEYSDKRGARNEYHVRELYRDELARLVGARFPHSAWHGQRVSFFSVVWPEAGATRGEIFEVSEVSAGEPTPGHHRPLYFIVVAAMTAEPLAAVVPRLSVLADRDEWVYGDYEKVMRELIDAHRRIGARETELGELREARAGTARQRDHLQAVLDAERGEAQRLRQELARREGLRWWLTLPLRRLRDAIRGAGQRA